MKKKVLIILFAIIIFASSTVFATDYCPICSSSNTFRFCDGIDQIFLDHDHPVTYQNKTYDCDVYEHIGRTNVQCDSCGYDYTVSTHLCIVEHMITQCPSAGQNSVCPY